MALPKLVGVREQETPKTGLAVPQDILEVDTPRERVVAAPKAPRDPSPILEAAAIVLTALCRALAERFVPYVAMIIIAVMWFRIIDAPSYEQLGGAGAFSLLIIGLVALLRR